MCLKIVPISVICNRILDRDTIFSTEQFWNQRNTRQVSSMIHSVRPHSLASILNIEICFVLLDFEKSRRTYVRVPTDGRTMCAKNNDHYGRPSGSKFGLKKWLLSSGIDRSFLFPSCAQFFSILLMNYYYFWLSASSEWYHRRVTL